MILKKYPNFGRSNCFMESSPITSSHIGHCFYTFSSTNDGVRPPCILLIKLVCTKTSLELKTHVGFIKPCHQNSFTLDITSIEDVSKNSNLKQMKNPQLELNKRKEQRSEISLTAAVCCLLIILSSGPTVLHL
jgi:hypothetical protein